MLTSSLILKDVNESKFEDIQFKLECLMKPVYESSIGQTEAKHYGLFIQHCLKTFISKIKSIKDNSQLDEVVSSAVVCGKCSVKLLSVLDEDRTFVVPSLLYHIIHSITDTKVLTEYLLDVSQIVIDIFQKATFPLPDKVHNVVYAFYSFLWNTSCTLLKQGNSVSLKCLLQIRKSSLIFLCYLPVKDELASKIHGIISHFSKYDKKWIDAGTTEVFYDIFVSVVDRLRLHVSVVDGADRTNVECAILQIQGMLVEHLLKVLNVTKASEVMQSISASDADKPLTAVMANFYEFSTEVTSSKNMNVKVNIDLEKLRKTNKLATGVVDKEVEKELLVLYASLSYFIQLLSSKSLEGLTVNMLHTLAESCVMLGKVSKKLLSMYKKVTDGKKEKGGQNVEETSDSKTRVILCNLIAYYRHLQLLHLILEAKFDKESTVLRECLDLSEKYVQDLDESERSITEKNIHAQRCNLGYVCSNIGYICLQERCYTEAATMYTIVVKQFHKCQQTSLLSMYEKLVECYQHQEKWIEASECLVQALATVDDSLKHVATIWARMKREALNKEESLTAVTLNAIVEKCRVKITRYTSRQILLAEYQAWKNFSRRHHVVEYHILCELLDVAETSVQKAEAMISIAMDSCITGQTYKERSTNEMLNDAIILLDKNISGAETSLALACYTKYIMAHEHSIEQIRSEYGEQDIFVCWNIQDDKRFTLQDEQSNLPFLVRAIELWEKYLKDETMSPEVKKTKSTKKCLVAKQQKTNTDCTSEDSMFNLEHHIDCLIMCATRLLTMKQPQLAERALQVAKHQIPNLTDSKRTTDLTLCLTRALMSLGKYEEAESVIDAKGDNQKQKPSVNMSLVMSELYILVGKSDEGLQLLQSLLDNEQKSKRVCYYLNQGTAKRLLSMGLCLPSAATMITSTNQYLLSLAFEAVHCHVSVLNCLTKNGTASKNADKWMMLNEVLSSLLHLCQLCRFIGLPRDALCYLRAGLNISQGQGLPRWSCEFLFEILSVQSMEADSEKALTTVDYLNCIISAENVSKVTVSQNQSKPESKTLNQSKEYVTSDRNIDPNKIPFPTAVDPDCFGFQNLAVTPIKLQAEQSDKTPDRIYSQKELDSGRKLKMKQLEVPECICMKQNVRTCSDQYRHKLCMRAGVVLSDFLTQNGMKSSAQRLLDDVQSKFKLMSCIETEVSEGSGREIVAKNGNSFPTDPCLLYAYLEAACIQAESYLHQCDFHKVHNIWKSLQKLEQSGCLKSVLHSNILLTRLALCDATGYMLSLHDTRHDEVIEANQSEMLAIGADCGTSETTELLEAAGTRKKVSFGSESEMLIVTGTKLKTSRKKLLKEEINSTPSKHKSSLALLNTPKVNFANKPQKLTRTPATNKMAALERIMASDDLSDQFTVLHEDEVFFPPPKPVTPRVGPKGKTSKSRVNSKCKTEPRKKKPFNIAEDKVDDTNLACDLFQNTAADYDDDDDISFPVSKPITPKPVSKPSKSAKSISKLSSKCRTEPRNPRNTKSNLKLNDSTDGKDIGCKLNFSIEANDSIAEEISKTEEISKIEEISQKEEISEVVERVENLTEDDQSDEEKSTSKPEELKRKVGSTKSKLPTRTLKPSAKGKSSNTISVADDSVYVFKEKSVKSLNDRRKVLKEKAPIKKDIVKVSDILLDKSDKNDVFDFDLEASPCVAKVTKGKGKQTKSTQKGRKNKATAAKKEATKEDVEEIPDKENVNVAPVRKRTRGTRQNVNEIETVRGKPDYLDEEMKLDMSLDELLDFRSDSDTSVLHASFNRTNGKLGEPITESSIDWFDDKSDLLAGTNLEPKETMRGYKKPKTTRNTRTCGNTKKVENIENEDCNERTNQTDKSADDDAGNGVEKMRSGRETSLKNLTACLNSEDDVKILPVERPISGTGSPSETDIISTLELLYERLCQFPPNPQHSDTCHMLALHHLHTNPRRAAFLLSDAMAVTFRHQVMLNTDRKARKESEGQGIMGSNVGLAHHNQMFRKEDENLETSIKAIPEDWCVVQLSVVSTGSSWKQLILTRFVKDQAPVVLRLPGFSSPQGRYILKEFSSILQQGAETAKIENISEWWSVRRKLDADMLSLVERMEKHWLGIWRCSLLPGKCRPDVLNRAQKDITKITQTDVELSYIGLLLLAEKTVSEKELKQCIEHIVGSTVDSSDLDKLVSVVKKYSKCMVSHGDKQHTILILDKTVQHLPWECMTILSERSVSRMPCLSHLVTQLHNLQAQESSVFMQGVNPRHTFYIINPDSDLPRTEEFFKEWFEREEGWKGVMGEKPKSEQFIEALTERDFLIYCGHGSGGRFFTSHEIEKLSARAVALLMGCSSGRLLVKGQLEASGMMISYFLAGCPSMVANLWDVTDKDIDKFTGELVQKWLSACQGTYLSKEVQKARSVCKLKYLNGFAPVVYGLPVFINNGKS